MKVTYSIECWVFGPDSRVLLLQVPAQPGRHDTFWQPVTGGIEPGESSLIAVMREVREETSLRLPEGAFAEVADGVDVVIDSCLTVRKSLYLAYSPQYDITVNPEEHLTHQWLPPREVPSALYWDSNRTTWALVADRGDLPRGRR